MTNTFYGSDDPSERRWAVAESARSRRILDHWREYEQLHPVRRILGALGVIDFAAEARAWANRRVDQESDGPA